MYVSCIMIIITIMLYYKPTCGGRGTKKDDVLYNSISDIGLQLDMLLKLNEQVMCLLFTRPATSLILPDVLVWCLVQFIRC